MSADPEPVAFVDTNILVYAMANEDVARAPVAQALIKRLMIAKAFRSSTQVLQELFVTLTRKGRKPFSVEEALRYLDRIAAYPVVTLDYGAVRAAAELSARETLSFWDALIIIAALRVQAGRLYSEDLQDGRTILGVQIVNPFR
jgi:predicted nucleic acid-binding protein